MPALLEIRKEFHEFADKLMMVNKVVIHPHRTKGRYYSFFAKFMKHYFTMDQGSLVVEAVQSTKKHDEFLRLWRMYIVDPYNEALEEVRADVARQYPGHNVRCVLWEINLVQAVLEFGGAC